MSQSPTKKKSKGGGRSYLRDSRISIDGARHPDIPPRQSSRSPPFPPPPGHPSFSTSFSMSRNNAASLSFPSTSFATSRNNATSSALDFVHPTAFGTAATTCYGNTGKLEAAAVSDPAFQPAHDDNDDGHASSHPCCRYRIG